MHSTGRVGTSAIATSEVTLGPAPWRGPYTLLVTGELLTHFLNIAIAACNICPRTPLLDTWPTGCLNQKSNLH